MIESLYIDAAVAGEPEANAVVERLGLPAQVIDDPQRLFAEINADPDPVGRGKRTLMLTANRGAPLRPCPGTREYTCCNYEILHVGTFCTMDCAYCILQAYFHPPLLQYFVNRRSLDQALNARFAKPEVGRIGTGEFTDSLIWEPWTDLNPWLIERFAGQRRCTLELKTKTVAVRRLLQLPHQGRTIMAWSLNTPRIIAGEERSTAPLDARLKAAARCAAAGFPVAFHFDPMFLYPGCHAQYQGVVRALFRQVPAEAIVWISMGTFRFMPPLKRLVQQRFPESKIAYGEFVRGLDDKMRYFKPLRIALYRDMAGWIGERAPEVCVYLCMEDEEVWQKAFGFRPEEKGGLPRMLDESACRHCGLAPETETAQ